MAIRTVPRSAKRALAVAPDELIAGLRDVVRRHPQRVVLACVVVVGIALRLYRFGDPPFDVQSFRQTQTAGTIWLWQRDGLDLLDYRVPVFGGGHWALEFPAYEFLSYLVAPLFGDLERGARLISILAYVASVVLLYLIVLRVTRRRLAALSAALVFSIVPISVFYFRAIMIDTVAVALGLAALYLALRLRDRVSVRAAAALWSAALLAALIKPPVVAAFLAPIAVLYSTVLVAQRRNRPLWVTTGVGAIVSAVVLVAWKEHTDTLNAASNGLTFDKQGSWYFGSTFTDPHLFATMWERALTNIGWVGLPLVVAGLVVAFTRRGRHRPVLIALALGTPLSICVFANLNRIHDYYQLPYYATIALFAGIGVAYIADLLGSGPMAQARHVAVIALGAFAVSATADLFRGYFAQDAVNTAFGTTGEVIRQSSAERDRVVVVAESVDYNDSTLLYAARRTGWIVDKARPDLLPRVANSGERVGAVVVLKGVQGVPDWATRFAAARGLGARSENASVVAFR